LTLIITGLAENNGLKILGDIYAKKLCFDLCCLVLAPLEEPLGAFSCTAKTEQNVSFSIKRL
jgi:hypothetical protein